MNGITYYNPVVHDSIVYSIDKVRISFQLVHSVSLELRNEPDNIRKFFDYIQLKSDEETLYRKIVFERIYTHQRNKNRRNVIQNLLLSGYKQFTPDIQMISQVTAQFVNEIRGQNIKSA